MSKIAVITGASKGIGAATAIAFGEAGYDVAINYHTDEAAAGQVARQVEAAGQKALLVKADIFTEEGVEQLFDTVKTVFGKVDVLVNNAGLPKEPDFGEYTAASVANSIHGNFTSALLCTQKTIPLMPEGGCVLFTSSIYGLPFGGNPGLVLYSAGKAALINLAQTLAEKFAPTIRFNVVAPGTTRTAAWDNKVDGEYAKHSLDMTLQKEWVAAKEIAQTFLYLASTPHINAQTIVVDGGWQKKIR